MLQGLYNNCHLCPRSCGANRNAGEKGFCGMTDRFVAARAALHMCEEPCISGRNGSGTVFISGCTLGCVYCQNRNIALGLAGKEIPKERLVEIFFELADQGANNINLVTADHFIPGVAEAIKEAKKEGFSLPFLLNTGSYIHADTLKLLDGLVDIYLPDLKYIDPKTAGSFSHAPDYPEIAKAAIDEMVRQLRSRCGGQRIETVFNGQGIMQRGIIIRHLLLPGRVLEAKLIVKYLFEKYGDEVYLSLMNQYTPPADPAERIPKLARKVTEAEYRSLIGYAAELGVKNGFMQEGETADESFIPEFDGEGV